MLKTGDISKLISPWKGPTTEKNPIAFTSALCLLRNGVGQSLLGAEVMTKATKKVVFNAIPVEVSRVMRLNESLVGLGMAESFNTFII